MEADPIKEMARARREQARRLSFFDAGIWLGRPQGLPLAGEIEPERLGSALADHLLDGGLVSHWRSKTVSAADGNAAVTDGLSQCHGNLFGVWTGLPLEPRENSGPLPGRDDVPASIRAVRIFPRSHGFPLEAWSMGTLCEWLIERGMPLLVWHVEIDWPPLYRLAKAYPDLPIIVETQTQKLLYHTRPLFALMRDCANVHVELSNFAGAGFVEYAVGQFGAERLVFGSFLPMNDPFVPMGMVLDAEIADADRKLIAGDNLRRLIGETRE